MQTQSIFPYLIVAAALLILLGATANATAQEWKETKSPEGNFAVLMPGVAEHLEQTVETEAGERVWHNFAVGTRQGDCGWMASYQDLPPAYVKENGAESILDERIDHLSESNDVTSERPFQAGQITGREVRLANETNGRTFYHFLRIFLVGNRLYKLHVAAADSLPPAVELRKFVDSFRLLR